MMMWIQPNTSGGFEVWREMGAAREHIATFKRKSDAKTYIRLTQNSDIQIALLKEIYEWTEHKETPWAKQVAAILQPPTFTD